MPDLTRPRYNATVIMPGLEIIGQIEPIGPWLDFLNSRDKHTITNPISPARFLAWGGPATAGEQPQVYANRAEIQLIYLPDRAARETVHMMKTTQLAICHLGSIVCRGEFHMGVDASLLTHFDDLPGNFFPVTNAELFSTVPLPSPLPRKADLVFLNRAQVQLYRPA
jgi:hypothetical protein